VVVEAAGGTLTDIVKLTIYVTDRQSYKSNLKPIGQAYRSFFGRYFPATTLVEVEGLFDDGALIEMDGFAVLGEGDTDHAKSADRGIWISRRQKRNSISRPISRAFAQERIAPLAREMDERGEMPLALVREMAARGLLGGPLPKEYGGGGWDAYHSRCAMRNWGGWTRRCAGL